jgi:putative pre-16S rRNA nuclease
VLASAAMRVLGLDLGARRIGLAISDPEGKIAFPAGCLERRGRRQDLAALLHMARERGVERVVVGLPIHLDGRVGAQAEAARAFARELAGALELPVDLLDERWTSAEAERHLRAAGRRASRRRERGEVDAVAAALLLSTYLERRRGGTAEEGA